MTTKIKKHFYFSLLLLFGIFMPLWKANAAWYDFLVNAITYIPRVFISLLLYIVGAITALLAGLASVILNWVISPNFTTLSYTNPAGNPIIKAGLDVTQGFVNMILVLVLVYIALATILRLAGYETKKLLVTFIIVALLVNFAPLVCGIIVDASNIIMNFFTSKVAGGSTVVNRLSSLWNSVGDFNWASFDLVAGLGQMFNLLTIVFMNIMLFLILLLFAVLFMARYIVIWILVILSPLAFAFYILPATKKWWTLWWTQLLQWSIIGVTCSFFLYLGDQLSALGPGVYGEAEGIGTAVLPFVVPVVFLIIGLIFGLQTGAMGASAVMGLTKRGGKWVGGKAWKGMALGDRKFLPSFDKDNKKFKAVSPRHAAGFITKKWEGIGNIPYAGRVLRPARWFLPEKLRDYGDYRTNIAAQGETIGPSPDAMYRVATGVYTGAKAAKVLSDIIRERGDGQDVMKAYMQKYNLKNEEDLLNDPRFLNDRTLIDALESISKAGDLSKVMRIEPRLTGVAAAGGLGSYKAFKGKDGKVDKFGAMKKAFEDIKPGDTAKWEREAVQNHDVIRAAMVMGDENLIRAIANNTKGGMKTVMKAWHKSYEEWINEAMNETEEKLRKDGKIITKKGERLTEDEALTLISATESVTAPDDYINKLEEKFGVVKGSSGIRKAYSNIRMQSQGLEMPRRLTVSEKAKTVATPGEAAGVSTPPPKKETVEPTGPTPKGRTPGGRKPGSTKKPSGRLPPDAYIG